MIVPRHVIARSQVTPPSDCITIGHIGVGRMGGGHVSGFLKMPDARILAISDVRLQTLERAQGAVNKQYGDSNCGAHPDFRELRCEIYGVSRDSLKAHESFKSKMKFPFDLVSDTEETACRLFDVIKLKNMYGRKVRGIERSTFVIDARGIVRRAWRGVKVPDHAREVLEFVKTLK